MTLALSFTATGCRKKVGAVPAPVTTAKNVTPDQPLPGPRITTFSVEPSRIDRGQQATLRWSAANATEVTIDQGIGTVPANGTRTVSPPRTTTYTLTAKGPGGTDTRTATLTVSEPTVPQPQTDNRRGPSQSFNEWINSNLNDAFFDLDKFDIREDARGILTSNGEKMRRAVSGDYSSAVFLVEGHCDERGSAEYNLGLGDRRATAAKEFLVQLGVPADRVKTVSYGKERPQCTDSNEGCWQKNRRAHFSAAN
jgi:peptidoglycan-associated lipoprotein